MTLLKVQLNILAFMFTFFNAIYMQYFKPIPHSVLYMKVYLHFTFFITAVIHFSVFYWLLNDAKDKK